MSSADSKATTFLKELLIVVSCGDDENVPGDCSDSETDDVCGVCASEEIDKVESKCVIGGSVCTEEVGECMCKSLSSELVSIFVIDVEGVKGTRLRNRLFSSVSKRNWACIWVFSSASCLALSSRSVT